MDHLAEIRNNAHWISRMLSRVPQLIPTIVRYPS